MGEFAKFIKPSSPGLIVRDPRTKTALSEKGEWKPMSGKEGTYWKRRIEDGSIIIAEEAKAAEVIEEKKEYYGGKK